jgi:hypothetical protein
MHLRQELIKSLYQIRPPSGGKGSQVDLGGAIDHCMDPVTALLFAWHLTGFSGFGCTCLDGEDL